MADSVCKKRKVDTREPGDQETPERPDKLCDICEVDQNQKADGLCQQCRQNLCKTCCLHHGKVVGTKHHTIRKHCANDDSPTSTGTLFGKRIVPWMGVALPEFPMEEGCDKPEIKYVSFFKDTGTMIVLCRYPKTKYYAIFELKGGKYGRHSIGFMVNELRMCLCMINNQVVVLSSSNSVLMLDISKPFFTTTEMFKTTGECQAIVEFDGGFAIAMNLNSTFRISAWQIQCLDRDWNLKHTISNGEDGMAYFRDPKCLASNYYQNKLYVSDSGKQNIRAFNIAGELVFTFSKDVTKPGSMTVDREGHIYVMCSDKCMQVREDGKEHNICFSKQIFSEKDTLAFDFSSDLLILGDSCKQTLQYVKFV